MHVLVKGAGADVNLRRWDGQNALSLALHKVMVEHDVATCMMADYSDPDFSGNTFPVYLDQCPEMAFGLLCSGANPGGVIPYRQLLSQKEVNSAIEHYLCVQTYIDAYHTTLKDILFNAVQVDTRVGRGDNGIYQEPLERVLEYMGLSLNFDQVVNAYIDGAEVKRALIPRHVLNAKVWLDLQHRAPRCSSCSKAPTTRLAKLKKCSCGTTRYCNIECQRKHWRTHRPHHKELMLKKK
jgi:hypothetical protein